MKNLIVFFVCAVVIGCSSKEERLNELSAIKGSNVDGIHLLFSKNKISEEDYWLMKANKYSTYLAYPDVPKDELISFSWYSGDSDLRQHGFGNSHGTKRGGTWYVDSFYYGQPRVKYRIDSKQVLRWYEIEKKLRNKTKNYKSTHAINRVIIKELLANAI